MLKIAPQFMLSVVKTRENLKLSDVERKHIDKLWKEAKQLQPSLYNGKILNFVSFNGIQLIGESIPYKYYAVQKMDPDLKRLLNINPISISGLTFFGDKILVGKRSKTVSQYKGYLELVPSGSLEPGSEGSGEQINLTAQVLRELTEETGIKKAKSIKPFELIFDRNTGLYEICVAIFLSDKILKEPIVPSAEYQELFYATREELEELLARKKWVPLSTFLIENYHSKITLPDFPESIISNPFSKSSKAT